MITFPIKTTNGMYIDSSGICKTRIWKENKGIQVMIVINTDRETAEAYVKHLNRVPLLWKPEEEHVDE